MILFVGCINIPPLVDCTSRTDCARDEICQEGSCIRGTSVYREPSNSLIVPMMDAGIGLDAESRTDGGQNPPVDAGPSCLNVTIEGRSEMFCTIADAIANAMSGDKLILPAIDISEAIILVDKQLTISGSTQGTQKTRLTPPNGQIGIQGGAVGAVFEHIEVQAQGAEGIRLAENSVLRLVKVTSASGAGVVVTGNATVLLENPIISGVLSNGSDVQLGAGAGLKLDPGTAVSVQQGTISDCQGSGIYSASATLTLSGTTLIHNNYGLEVRNPSMVTTILVTLNNTNALENKRSGFYVWATPIQVNNCTSNNNGTAMIAPDGHGFYFGPGTTPAVEGNSAQMNIGYGMFCGPDVVPSACSQNSFGSNGMAGTNCAGGQ